MTTRFNQLHSVTAEQVDALQGQDQELSDTLPGQALTEAAGESRQSFIGRLGNIIDYSHDSYARLAHISRQHAGKLAAPFVVAAMSLGVTGCFSGEGTPVSGPDKASCETGYPPTDVKLPADTCGVKPLHIPKNPYNIQIPREPKAGSLELDLYIEGDHTCGIGPGLCAVDDNRPYVSAPSPDPEADPTRNRVHMVLDFAAQTIMVQISPSCRIHAVDLPAVGGVGLNGSKECFAPNQIGEGTDLNVSSPKPGTVEIQLDVLQTAYYAPGRVGQIQNVFDFTPHPDGSVNFSGYGTNFPDLAIIRDGEVLCSDQATHITAALAGATRTYSCNLPPSGQTVATLTPQAFATKVNALCRTEHDQISAIPVPTDLPSLAVSTGEEVSIIDEYASKLASIQPPPKDGALAHALVEAFHQNAATLSAEQSAAEQGNLQKAQSIDNNLIAGRSPVSAANAAKLGLYECVSPVQPQG